MGYRSLVNVVAGAALLPLAALPLAGQRLPAHHTGWTVPITPLYDLEVTADGLVWATTQQGIVRFDPDTGTSTAYLPLGLDKEIKTLTQGVDGALWLVDRNERILRFDPTTTSFVAYEIPSASFGGDCFPFDLVIDAARDVWFTCSADRTLGRLRPGPPPKWSRLLVAGSRLPDPPMGIALDRDGLVWFTMRRQEGASPGFGWLDPADPTGPGSGWTTSIANFLNPHGILLSRGDLWFIDHSWNLAESQLVRVDPETHGYTRWQLPDAVDDAHFLTVDGLGRLFTAGLASSSIAVFDPASETFQVATLPSAGAAPMGMTADRRGAIWWAGGLADGSLGRLVPFAPAVLAVGVDGEDASQVDQGAVASFRGARNTGLTAAGNDLLLQGDPRVGQFPGVGDRFGRTMASGDFDGDHAQDLAIGIPDEDLAGLDNTGEVRVLYSTAGKVLAGLHYQWWNQGIALVEGELQAYDELGNALAVGDFNRDGYDDLAIGIHNERIGDPVVYSAGAVLVVLGGAGGLGFDGLQRWYQGKLGIEQTPEDGDSFGETLASGDFDGDGFADLAVGVPLEDWGGLSNAGVVQVLYGGLDGLSWSGDQLLRQGAGAIAGATEAGDQLGRALAVADFDGDGYDDLAMGAPYEEVDGVLGAGIVELVYGSAAGLGAWAQSWHQGNTFIDDELGVQDYFGAALAACDFDGDGFADLAIGVPGETISGRPGAGAVDVLYGSELGLTALDADFWHQDAGVSGTTEIGDGFGAALGCNDFDGDGFADLVVGVPTEDVSTAVDAGAANVLYGSTGGLATARQGFLHQNASGVLGTAESGDRFGGSLCTLQEPLDVLWADGFESGDARAWSSATP